MRPANPAATFRCEATLERELHARGFRAVAGVDEVGRGALFGPVVAAAVILSPDRPVRGLNDSKQLEPEQRETLAEAHPRARRRLGHRRRGRRHHRRHQHLSGLAFGHAPGGERLNPAPDFLLIDAVPIDLPLPQRPLIKGDARCHAIAAASIVAKVYRDACMRVWDEVFPAYGLASHKGYSTPEHCKAIEEFGLTPLHRLSFEPVRARSLFPIDYNLQMELFETAGAA